MRRISRLCALLFVLLALPASSLAVTRALLVACSDFVTQPSLGNASSGNLQMIGSALLGLSPRPQGLSIEDGTLASPQALAAAIAKTFDEASQDDLSLLYLCTHGISSSDDGKTFLLLSDGTTESTLSSKELYAMLSPIPGEKLLIVDACFSGGMIGRNPSKEPSLPSLSGSPFLADPSIHVLTSASGHESSWYYDAQQLSTGAVSYFASAFSGGLGLYGSAEADVSGDGIITLQEMHSYLCAAVPSSSSQLLSSDAQSVFLPAVARTSLARPLSGFSYGELLLSAEEPMLDFSFTVTKETAVQYRLIDFDEGRWNWENAKTFLDAGDAENTLLTPGRKSRTLTLDNIAPDESGYLMLQVFSVSGDELLLCSERLVAVQPATKDHTLSLRCPAVFSPGMNELSISVKLGVPAEITVSVFDDEGRLVHRICQSQMTRPAPGNESLLYWDGRAASGSFVPAGTYTVTAEAFVGGKRQKAAVNVSIE